MQAQAQYTIHALNDVIASNTAPSTPYVGQLWVYTNYSPPRTFVYTGTEWREQNGTDSLRSSISTLTTKSNTLQSSINGLSGTVSEVSSRVETVENDLEVVEQNVLSTQTNVSILELTASGLALRVSQNETSISSLNQTATSLSSRLSTAEGNISTLTQTSSELTATVASKADSVGGSEDSFSWVLTSEGFELISCGEVIMAANEYGITINGTMNAISGSLADMKIDGRLSFGDSDEYFIDPNYGDSSYYISLPGFRVDESSGAVFSGRVTAVTGSIGGFTLKSNALYNNKTAYSNNTTGVYIGTDGIGLGVGAFYVTSAGSLYSKSGTIGGFTITSTALYKTKTAYSNTTAGVYIGTDGIGLGAGAFYVNSSGSLYSKSGTIGGFTITSTALYKTKTAYSNTTAGVYIGTDGIGLGSGTFYVTSAGSLTATSATITGTVNATSGTLSSLTINGRLYFGNNQSYYIDANMNDTSYYIYLPGFRVDDASGAVFSGKLSAASGSFSGTITASGGKIGDLDISDGTLTYGTVDNNTATGVRISTTTVWAKYGYFTSGRMGCWSYNTLNLYSSYQNLAGFNGEDHVYFEPANLKYRLYGINSYPSVRWQTIVDVISSASSDSRVKTDIESLSSSYEVFFDHLIPRRYKYVDGVSGRYHTGFIAQEVVAAIETANLTLTDFAAAMLESPGSENETWKLRRDEFVALNTWEIQKLKALVKELQQKISNLEDNNHET